MKCVLVAVSVKGKLPISVKLRRETGKVCGVKWGEVASSFPMKSCSKVPPPPLPVQAQPFG